jgi:hypothetical protein
MNGVPEQRHALRLRPRRTLTMRLTRGEGSDAVVLADWVARNQGRQALIPLPHLKRRAGASAKGAATLTVTGVQGRFQRAMQPLEPGLTTFNSGVIQPSAGSVILIADPVNGHQVVYASVSGQDTLTITEPLARPVSAGSAVYPLVAGTLRQAARFDHLAGRVTDTVLDIELAPCPFSRVEDGGWLPQETWDGLPVFSARLFGGTWDDQGFEFSATVEVLDNEAAVPWVARVSDNPGHTLRRRILVAEEAAIEHALGLVDYLRGRQQPVWLDDALSGMALAAPVAAGDIHIDMVRGTLPYFARTPGVLSIDGHNLAYAGISTQSAGVARVHLAAPATASLPVDACVTRLLRARLDHDAVDLIWHTDGVLEINLIFRVIEK